MSVDDLFLGPAASGPRPKLRAVFLVYDARGRPKVSADFYNALSPVEQLQVDADLRARGYAFYDGVLKEI